MAGKGERAKSRKAEQVATDDRPPQADELPELAEKLVYEFRMWVLALGMCGLAGAELGPRNAWLEVFLLHTRTLADFFLSDPKKDDVVATHYVPNWCVTQEESSWMRDQKKKLDKSLAHLTATRVRVEHPKHSIDDIRRNILALWTRFEAAAREESTDAARALTCLLT